MAKEKHYILSRDEAKKVCTRIIDEIYDKKPVSFRFEMHGAVDELPMIHVAYDADVYSLKIGSWYADDGSSGSNQE